MALTPLEIKELSWAKRQGGGSVKSPMLEQRFGAGGRFTGLFEKRSVRYR